MSDSTHKREWKAADIVRHFKGTTYIIIGTGLNATNSDNNEPEEVVIYKRLDCTGPIWVRNRKEFESKVDKKKYPDAEQEYRFELISTFK